MMIRGILGGSFNPPHIGHTLLGLYALETMEIDQVAYIPAGAHPFGKDLVDFEHRLRMTQLAVAGLGERAEALDIERGMPRPTYTYHTLRALTERYPGDELRLIVGTDILKDFDKWFRAEDVRRLAPPIVIARAGYETGETRAVLPEVSSSCLRERLRVGASVDGLLSRAVKDYIQEQGLFGVSNATNTTS